MAESRPGDRLTLGQPGNPQRDGAQGEGCDQHEQGPVGEHLPEGWVALAMACRRPHDAGDGGGRLRRWAWPGMAGRQEAQLGRLEGLPVALVEGAVGGGEHHPGGDQGAGADTADAPLHDPDRLPGPAPGIDRDAIVGSEDAAGPGWVCRAAWQQSSVESEGEVERN